MKDSWRDTYDRWKTRSDLDDGPDEEWPEDRDEDPPEEEEEDCKGTAPDRNA